MRFSHNVAIALALLPFTLLPAGCASTILPSKGPRPPSDFAAVKLYQTSPAKYEILGTVEADGPLTWAEDGSSDKMMDILQEKVAALGGNGLLLKVPHADDPAEKHYWATIVYRNLPYQVSMLVKPKPAVQALAIFVYPPG